VQVMASELFHSYFEQMVAFAFDAGLVAFVTVGLVWALT